MRAKFIRGVATRKDLLDRLLDRIITVEMPVYDIDIVNGKLDTTHENTRDFVDELEKAGISYVVSGESSNADPYPYVEISGTKPQIISVLPLWDAHQRDVEELERELEDWDGDVEQLMNILT
jgi:hypothetical protein